MAYPSSIADEVVDHLARFVRPERDALVFTGEQGGPLRPHVLGALSAGPGSSPGGPSSPYDLRHTA